MGWRLCKQTVVVSGVMPQIEQVAWRKVVCFFFHLIDNQRIHMVEILVDEVQPTSI